MLEPKKYQILAIRRMRVCLWMMLSPTVLEKMNSTELVMKTIRKCYLARYSITVKEKRERRRKKVRVKQRNGRRLRGIRVRTSPNELYEAVMLMKPWQRKLVKEMGFGKMLKLKVSDITTNLGHFVVDMLDTQNMRITLGDRYINVDKGSVRKLLGVPAGGIRMVKKKKDDPPHPLKNEWVNRFQSVPVSFRNIVDKIRLDPYEDDTCSSWTLYCCLFQR